MAKQKNTRRIGIIILLLLVAYILSSHFLFTIYDHGSINCDGYTCLSNGTCSGTIPEEDTRIETNWMLCQDSPPWFSGTPLESPSVNYFLNKTCYVQLNSDMGIIKFYGRTELSGSGCGTQVGCFPHVDFVTVNDIPADTSYGGPIDLYTNRGAKYFSANLLEVHWDFSTSEYPNPFCNEGSTHCDGYTKFTCVKGVYILTERNSTYCGYNLSCTNGEFQYHACSNGTQYVFAHCINSKWVPQEYLIDPCKVPNCVPICGGVSCDGSDGCGGICTNNCGGCTSNSDCENGYSCSNGSCILNPNPSGNWYDIFLKKAFAFGSFTIVWWMVGVALIAFFLILK